MSFDGASSRGVGRGRGRGRGLWRGATRGRDAALQPLLPARPLGPTIDSINSKTLLIDEGSPEIEDVKYVASYNWLSGDSPVMLVPGSPPAWTPLAEDTQLNPDSGIVYRDINAFKYPPYPYEPALRSILALQPEFDFNSVDVIGCGSTLGNLLRFAGSQSKPFRFDADVIGDTVFFVRKESSPEETIEGIKGYGHTFPDAYTTWDADVGNSCSHQRIIQYEFGGLQFLVRSETDGYVKGIRSPPSNSGKPAAQPSLEEAFDNIAVEGPVSFQGKKLELKMQGTKVAQGQIFDIKTRSRVYNRVFNMEDILPRLWLNQTPKFLLAYHIHGLFDKPQVRDVRQDVLDWQKNNSDVLGRFHAVVKRIVDVVRDSDTQQVEVSWDGQGPLLVTEQIGEGRRALPPALQHHWEPE